jgi:hypothetical protein
MADVPTIEMSATVGETRKLSVAQMLVYELRVRDAMSSPPVTAAPADSLRTIQLLMKARIKAGDFDSAGRVSQRLRQILRQRSIDADQQRRAAVVAYEAETNIIIHSIGGNLKATVAADKANIEAVDEGPGIEQLDLAMQESWSTAGPPGANLNSRLQRVKSPG